MSEPGAELSKFISSEILHSYNELNIPIAIANQRKTILWASNKFQELAENKVVGVAFNKLFNISEKDFAEKSVYREDNLFWSLSIRSFTVDENISHYILFINEKLQSSEKLKFQIKGIKSFAHDLNNILTSITNSSAMLKNYNVAQNDDTQKLVENIETNAHRAADIIQQVLTEGINKETIRKKVDLKNLLNELYSSLMNIVDNSVKVDLKIDSNLNTITANYSDIYRILLNLCMNSIEAVGRRGKIKIVAENIDDDNLKPSELSKVKNIVKITVLDNGSGIKKKNLDKIFTPGFSTKNKLQDSGLGLHIVKSLIEDHSGKIEVKSKWLRGTEFSIYLPGRDLFNNTDLSSSIRSTILVADDEESILELLTDLLESYNYKVINAKNGEEVIGAYKKENNIDLMIIDRKMPVMNGIESIKAVRNMNYKKPIILTTGSQSYKTDISFEEMPVDKVMIKPYDFEQLLVEVKQLLK
jgi:two-component system cell cycle sensor histidine kinase/response regulator CckA